MKPKEEKMKQFNTQNEGEYIYNLDKGKSCCIDTYEYERINYDETKTISRRSN